MKPPKKQKTTKAAAQKFFSDLNFSHTVVELTGGLGTGKTQFIRWGLEEITSDTLSSPSYSLINEYATVRGPVQHLDLYRLEEIDELENIAFRDLFLDDQLILIEWADVLGALEYPLGWSKIRVGFYKEADEFFFTATP